MAQKTVYVARGDDERCDGVIINITDRIKHIPRDDPQWMKSWRAYLQDQAKLVSDALFENLPGGVVDRLLAEMMARKASDLKVTFPI